MVSKVNGVGRPVLCLHECHKKPREQKTRRTYGVSTHFVRWHPFKEGWEIRRCPACLRYSAYSAPVQ